MSNPDQTRASMTMAFASPILHLPVPDAARLNETLIAEAHAIRDFSTGLHRSNRQGWHSDSDLMKRQEPGLTELMGIIRNAIHSATKTISPEFSFKDHKMAADAWININPQYGYNVPHKHSGFMWSGCYYVTVPEADEESSGSIEFLSPLIVPGEYATLGALCYADKITTRPKAGDMLLFPSYLTHWVVPNSVDAERITIAFNATYVRNEGGG
jgi:uncharacterized protein (TIGR02466 family)